MFTWIKKSFDPFLFTFSRSILHVQSDMFDLVQNLKNSALRRRIIMVTNYWYKLASHLQVLFILTPLHVIFFHPFWCKVYIGSVSHHWIHFIKPYQLHFKHKKYWIFAIYHTSNSCKCMESMGKPYSCMLLINKMLYFYYNIPLTHANVWSQWVSLTAACIL